jgi:RNA polymerase sigma-70 factor (ECF subfamily)
MRVETRARMPVAVRCFSRTRIDRAGMRDRSATESPRFEAAMDQGRPGRFALMAAIAAVHDQAPTWDQTDWRRIRELYDSSSTCGRSPVVALNRGDRCRASPTASSEGLDILTSCGREPTLAGYGYLEAARADFLVASRPHGRGSRAYEEAIVLTGNAAERGLLQRKLRSISPARAS